MAVIYLQKMSPGATCILCNAIMYLGEFVCVKASAIRLCLSGGSGARQAAYSALSAPQKRWSLGPGGVLPAVC